MVERLLQRIEVFRKLWFHQLFVPAHKLSFVFDHFRGPMRGETDIVFVLPIVPPFRWNFIVEDKQFIDWQVLQTVVLTCQLLLRNLLFGY